MMKTPRKKLPPKAPGNFRKVVVEELLAFWSFLQSNWYYVLPGLIVAVLLIYVVRPVPPKTMTIATGQAHSSADVVAHKYQAFFKTHGVDLQLVPSKGNQENLDLLEAGQVDAIFAQGGLPLGDNSSHLLSLGSISYLPLWLFYNGAEIEESDLNVFLASRRTSINIVGSSTRALLEPVLQGQGIDLAIPGLVELDTAKSIQALQERKIDAMFLSASMASENLRALAEMPGVHVYSFKFADAYARHYPHMSALTLPAGAFDLHPAIPSKDIKLIGSTMDILTTDKLHPALQLLLMQATEHFERKRVSYFSHGKFPAYIDTRIPESDVARRFFKEGSPLLWGYVPYWLASLFDEIWFYLLAIGAIIIPLMSFLPSYRKTHAELSMESCYDELRQVENEMVFRRDMDAPITADLLDQLDALKDKARALWVPTGNRTAYYDLRAAINIVREDIVASLEMPDHRS